MILCAVYVSLYCVFKSVISYDPGSRLVGDTNPCEGCIRKAIQQKVPPIKYADTSLVATTYEYGSSK